MEDNKLIANKNEAPQIFKGINRVFQSKTFYVILIAVIALAVALLIFKIGMFVGFKKTGFSYNWSENYHRNFAGPAGGFFRDFGGRDFIDSHGVFGQIIKIDVPILVIRGRDDIEKIVLAQDKTVIKNFRNTIKLSDLKVDDYIVVIGSPNQAGQVEAKLIRLVPPPAESMMLPPPGPALFNH